jgi:hypothetical protein
MPRISGFSTLWVKTVNWAGSPSDSSSTKLPVTLLRPSSDNSRLWIWKVDLQWYQYWCSILTYFIITRKLENKNVHKSMKIYHGYIKRSNTEWHYVGATYSSISPHCFWDMINCTLLSNSKYVITPWCLYMPCRKELKWVWLCIINNFSYIRNVSSENEFRF